MKPTSLYQPHTWIVLVGDFKYLGACEDTHKSWIKYFELFTIRCLFNISVFISWACITFPLVLVT